MVAMILPFSVMDMVDATPNGNTNDNVTEKALIKEKIKEKMIDQHQKDIAEKAQGKKYTSNEYGIPYNLIFEDNGKLIVGIDIGKAQEFKRGYSIDDVKADLQTNQDIDIRYYGFDREANVRGGDALVKEPDSATITVVKNNKIVTTGHFVDEDVIVIAGLVGGTGCEEVEITYNPYSDPQYADAAYGIDTYNEDCDHNYVNDSLHFNGNNYSVSYGTANDIYDDRFVRIAGITTTSSGYILDSDVTAKDDLGVLDDQVVANYVSDQGDSGAPIFAITGSSTAKLLGQHVGKFCEVDLNSGTSYGYWCGGGSPGLTVFSPWDQVASTLGI
jgi:hypothetical protein